MKLLLYRTHSHRYVVFDSLLSLYEGVNEQLSKDPKLLFASITLTLGLGLAAGITVLSDQPLHHALWQGLLFGLIVAAFTVGFETFG